MNDIVVEHDFPQPAALAFAFVADHETFFPAPRFVCRLREAGVTQRNGDGALREVRTGAACFVERISRFEPDRGFDYRIERLSVAGLPVPFRHERGWLEFHPRGAGCRVIWRSRFAIGVPLLGPALGRRFQRDAARAFAWLLRDAQRRLDLVSKPGGDAAR